MLARLGGHGEDGGAGRVRDRGRRAERDRRALDRDAPALVVIAADGDGERLARRSGRAVGARLERALAAPAVVLLAPEPRDALPVAQAPREVGGAEAGRAPADLVDPAAAALLALALHARHVQSGRVARPLAAPAVVAQAELQLGGRQ